MRRIHLSFTLPWGFRNNLLAYFRFTFLPFFWRVDQLDMGLRGRSCVRIHLQLSAQMPEFRLWRTQWKACLMLGLALATCGCVHRVPPHFSEHKCAKGTQEITAAYHYAENGRMVCCRSVTVCGIVDPVLTKQYGMPVVRSDVPPVMLGEDPFDVDGDEAAAADQPRKHWWQFWKSADDDRD